MLPLMLTVNTINCKPCASSGDEIADQDIFRNNVGGIAISGGGRVSNAMFRWTRSWDKADGTWCYLVAEDDNWQYCWPGPAHVATRQGTCFVGYRNLGLYDVDNKGLEVGRGGDFSTPRTKGTEYLIDVVSPGRVNLAPILLLLLLLLVSRLTAT